MPYRLSRILLASSALALSVPALAQEPTPQPVPKTHTVKRGDTLWDIAKLYLGDPFLWPEIYRINTDKIDDPHWIYPGEVLRLPGDVPKVIAAVPERPVTPTPLPVERPMLTPAPAPVDTTRALTQEQPISPIRFYEALAAPFVDQRGGPRGAGGIIKTAEIAGTISASLSSRFQVYDRVLFSPPVGAVAPERELYVSYVMGPLIEDFGQIVIPTGVVEVTRAPRSGEAGIARVVRMFGTMEEGQRLMPYDSAAAAVRGTAIPVPRGREGKIRWIYTKPVLPSIQQYILVDIGRREGVSLGDELELYVPRERRVEEGQLARPEIHIGRAQVVRVTQYGATAVLLEEEQPKIEEGTAVRVAAKMP